MEHLYNLRDLGGYEAGDGVIRWNRLYRCDCPCDLTEEEWRRLRELGIKTLIDLRSSFEAMESPVEAPEDMKYLPCRFFAEPEILQKAGSDLVGNFSAELMEAGKKFLDSLSIDYRVMTEQAIPQITAILEAILTSLKEGNAAFFCTAGKDRTGIIAAEILRICGVSDEDIIADYAITEIYNSEVIRKRLKAIPKEIMDQVSPETMEKALLSKAETMQEYLEWSEGFHFSDRIHEQGFTYEQQKALREQLVQLSPTP